MYVENLNVVANNRAKECMDVNVILTFGSEDAYGHSQEVFDLKIPVSKSEHSAVKFIHQKLFNMVVEKCAVLNRHPEDVIKISTDANWKVFEVVCGKKSLPSLGHSCKWYFGEGRADLDAWEECLMQEYGFGTECDISWTGNRKNSSEIQNLSAVIKKNLTNKKGGQQ